MVISEKTVAMGKQSVKDIAATDLNAKRVLVRVDFNVPMEAGVITDDVRIRAALPTIRYLIEKNSIVILCSHFGRPKGQVKDEFRLQPIAKRLQELLGQPVSMLEDCIGQDVETAVHAAKPKSVLLLENLRFYKEEEDNNEVFARKLAALADVYVNDAFGTAHRAHASTEGVAHFLPAYAGLLIEKELAFLGQAIHQPQRPFVCIIGGAKVSTKMSVLKNLLGKVDTLIIGGGMAYTFFKAQGLQIGKSLCEDNFIEAANLFLNLAKSSKTKVMFPVDCVVADAFDQDAHTRLVTIDQIPSDWQALDCGPETIALIKAEIAGARTVLWNGPLGVFEMDRFATGTNEVAKALAHSQAVTIVGGGDSAAAIEKAGLVDKITHVSTGGGASLEFLEGQELPGIAVLKDKTPTPV